MSLDITINPERFHLAKRLNLKIHVLMYYLNNINSSIGNINNEITSNMNIRSLNSHVIRNNKNLNNVVVIHCTITNIVFTKRDYMTKVVVIYYTNSNSIVTKLDYSTKVYVIYSISKVTKLYYVTNVCFIQFNLPALPV